ncbi:MAG: hypothetical protein CMM01_25305 [Rhodopirellula sp.]|nr:hypothetical protein [Rhodopirellula sp.]
MVLSRDNPGAESRNTRLEYQELLLTITASCASGTVSGQIDAGSGTQTRAEFGYKCLKYLFQIHEEINNEGSKASFDNGVLTLVFSLEQPPLPQSSPVSACELEPIAMESGD